jgi:hypothetical protein
MDTTIIVIQSDKDNDLTVPQKLQDVGKKLTKLMYNSQKNTLDDKSIVVVFPDTENSTTTAKYVGRIARDEENIYQEIISLQNSIRHIVRHAIKHGINITIQEH